MLHLKSISDPWEPNPISVFTTASTAPSSRSSLFSSSRTAAATPQLTKHQSLGSSNYGQQLKYSNQGFHSGGEINSTEIFLSGSCSRELSPVRWCDREVDGVYLGRSGWVQVQQRSLDENRRASYINDSLQRSRRVGIKLADYHKSKSEPGKCPEISKSVDLSRPIYLPINRDDVEVQRKTPSPPNLPESFSPPSITPIISPPPAFQDKNSKTTRTRTFFGKAPFLPRSNAIVDSDASPPNSPKPKWATPARKSKTLPATIEQPYRGYPKIPQAKSLEDSTATRRYKFLQKYGESSSSSSSSMGFRSLDSYVPRIAMPRLSENTDSSMDVYEDADEEDNNSSSVNMNVHPHKLEPIVRPKDRVSPTNRPSRPQYRQQTRRSPANSDTNKQPTSPTSSSSSGNEFPSRVPSGPAQQMRRSAPARPYQIQEDLSMRVRRSRSLQLPERKIPIGIREPSIVKVSPQHAEGHRIAAKVPNTKRHALPKTQTIEIDLDEETLREAEVVTGFLSGNRNKAAAQALLIHKYNNSRDEKIKEASKSTMTNNSYNVYVVGGKDRPKVFQRGLTAPNLISAKKMTKSELKNPCSSDTCDFWPHCANRDSLNSQAAQSMMRISHSYPSHQKPAEKPASECYANSQICIDKSPESYKPNHRAAEKLHHQQDKIGAETWRPAMPKKLLRADTEVTRPASGFALSRRPVPSGFAIETTKLSPIKNVNVDRKCSPVNLVARVPPPSRNPSSSSSSSDVYITTSDRTSTKSPKNVKSSGGSTPMDELPAVKDELAIVGREVILSRPGSAPGEENKASVEESQQRSMSLPKSFLSGSYQPE